MEKSNQITYKYRVVTMPIIILIWQTQIVVKDINEVPRSSLKILKVETKTFQ